MCTMSWVYHDEGYEMYFNRDETKARLIAYPPKMCTEMGVSFIAPIDADAGGTWMGVNAFGVSVCLLNGLGRVDPERTDYVSRGALVMSLLTVSGSAMVEKKIAQMDLTVYRPFSLVILEPTQSVVAWVWDGVAIWLDTHISAPLISSSFRLKDVEKNRKELFHRLNLAQTNRLEDYHRSHEPEAGPFSVCMHRDDAHTVSLSKVVVTAQQIHFYYAPGLPCQTDFLPPMTLSRFMGDGSHGLMDG
jgi:hypothetical protein